MMFREISRSLFPADFHQKHNFQCTAQVKFGSLQLATGFSYSSGLPFTDILSFMPVNSPMSQDDPYNINYARINSKTLEDLVELNLSINYQFGIFNNSDKGYLGLSNVNVLNRENQYSRSVFIDNPIMSPPRISELNKANLPATMNMSLRFEF